MTDEKPSRSREAAEPGPEYLRRLRAAYGPVEDRTAAPPAVRSSRPDREWLHRSPSALVELVRERRRRAAASADDA
jgi:hypothetical protein